MKRFGNNVCRFVGVVTLLLTLTISSPFVCAETYIVGAQDIEYYPYYNFASEHDKGLGRAILDAFSKKTGHNFIYLSMPVKRLQIELTKGNVDFVFPDNPEWYNQITHKLGKVYSKPLTDTFAVTLVRKEKQGAELSHISKLATPEGFSPVKWKQQIKNGSVEVIGVSSIYEGLRLLQSNKVDAFDVEYHASLYFIQRFPQSASFVADLTLPNNVVSFSLSTLNHPEIINELNTFLLTNSDEINDIKERYGIEDIAQLKKQLMDEQDINKNALWTPL